MMWLQMMLLGARFTRRLDGCDWEIQLCDAAANVLARHSISLSRNSLTANATKNLRLCASSLVPVRSAALDLNIIVLK